MPPPWTTARVLRASRRCRGANGAASRSSSNCVPSIRTKSSSSVIEAPVGWRSSLTERCERDVVRTPRSSTKRSVSGNNPSAPRFSPTAASIPSGVKRSTCERSAQTAATKDVQRRSDRLWASVVAICTAEKSSRRSPWRSVTPTDVDPSVLGDEVEPPRRQLGVLVGQNTPVVEVVQSSKALLLGLWIPVDNDEGCDLLVTPMRQGLVRSQAVLSRNTTHVDGCPDLDCHVLVGFRESETSQVTDEIAATSCSSKPVIRTPGR